MNTKQTVLIALVVVVVIAAIAAFALSGDDGSDDKGTEGGETALASCDVRIEYRLSFEDENTGSYAPNPEDGMKFLALRYTVHNDAFENGVKLGYTSNLVWTVMVDGEEADDAPSDDHPEHSDARVMVGEDGSTIEMFQVPSDCSIGDIEVSVESLLGDFEIGLEAL